MPAALDGLVAVLSASAALRGVQIFDGQPTTDTPKDFIAVGFSEDGPAVSFNHSPAGLGNARRAETFDITCVVSSWNGGTNAATVRNRAFAMFSACEAAIRAGGTLNASVLFAQVVQGSVTQMQTEQGAVCDVEFSVSVESRI